MKLIKKIKEFFSFDSHVNIWPFTEDFINLHNYIEDNHQILDKKIGSMPVFDAIKEICSEIGIREPRCTDSVNDSSINILSHLKFNDFIKRINPDLYKDVSRWTGRTRMVEVCRHYKIKKPEHCNCTSDDELSRITQDIEDKLQREKLK